MVVECTLYYNGNFSVDTLPKRTFSDGLIEARELEVMMGASSSVAHSFKSYPLVHHKHKSNHLHS